MLTGTGLAACSSSGNGARSSGAARGSAASAASTAGAGSGAASGNPPTLVSIVDNLQPGQDSAGLNAAVGAINAAGGIHGHKMVVNVCNDENDPNQAAACARQAAANPAVLAAVGNDTNYGAQVDPILAKAGIANIGPIPYSSTDFTDKNSYPTSMGTLSEAGQVAVAISLLHA